MNADTNPNELIQALKDPDSTVRSDAAYLLGKLKVTEAVPALIRALEDNELEVRRLAALALGEIGDKRAIEALTTAFRVNNLRRVYVAMAVTLAELGEEEPLVRALSESESGHVRSSTLTALADCGDGRAISSLCQLLKSEKLSWRYWAANALCYLEDKRALDSLILILKDSHADVRIIAAIGLGKLGDPRALPALREMQVTDTGVDWGGITAKRAASEAIERIKAHLEANKNPDNQQKAVMEGPNWIITKDKRPY